MAGEKRITMKDIARLAGVDKAIVSKVVNQVADGQVGAAKRKKIEEIIKRTGYTPSNAAKSLATNRTRQLMFLFSDKTFNGLSNDYYARMLRGVHDASCTVSHNCILNIRNFSDIHDFILPENLRDYSVDGCVLAGIFDDSLIEKLSSVRLPVVVIDRPVVSHTIPVVNHYDHRDTSPIIEYIKSNKHQRIWLSAPSLFQGSLSWPDTMAVERITSKSSDPEQFATTLVKRFVSLRKAVRPTVFLGDGHTCLYFLNRLKEDGLTCPGDISLISTSDFEAHRWCEPAMTLAVQDSYDIGKFAAKLLVDIITKKITQKEAVGIACDKRFPIRVIKRHSVCQNG